jgi:hypothetical protein
MESTLTIRLDLEHREPLDNEERTDLLYWIGLAINNIVHDKQDYTALKLSYTDDIRKDIIEAEVSE